MQTEIQPRINGKKYHFPAEYDASVDSRLARVETVAEFNSNGIERLDHKVTRIEESLNKHAEETSLFITQFRTGAKVLGGVAVLTGTVLVGFAESFDFFVQLVS